MAAAQKKKKWSKGKVKDRLNNKVLFDKATQDRLVSEIPKSKVITIGTVSDRLKINGSAARQGIRYLVSKGLIRAVVSHSKNPIYTRVAGEK